MASLGTATRDSRSRFSQLSAIHRRESISVAETRKVVTATLAFYVFAVTARLGGNVDIEYPPGAVWMGALGFAALISVHLDRLHRANEANLAIAQAAEDELIAIAGVEPLINARNAAMSRQSGSFNWSLWVQVTLIAAFAVAAAALFVAPVFLDEDDSSDGRLASLLWAAETRRLQTASDSGVVEGASEGSQSRTADFNRRSPAPSAPASNRRSPPRCDPSRTRSHRREVSRPEDSAFPMSWIASSSVSGTADVRRRNLIESALIPANMRDAGSTDTARVKRRVPVPHV